MRCKMCGRQLRDGNVRYKPLLIDSEYFYYKRTKIGKGVNQDGGNSMVWVIGSVPW